MKSISRSNLNVWHICLEFAYSTLQVLQYLLDDVSNFLSTHSTTGERAVVEEQKGCASILKAFIDYISERERVNFRYRRCENGNSVTLTTIHQVFCDWSIFSLIARTLILVFFHSYSTLSELSSRLSSAVQRVGMGHCLYSEGNWWP